MPAVILFFNACKEDYTSTDYLKKVLNKLEKIESATGKAFHMPPFPYMLAKEISQELQTM